MSNNVTYPERVASYVTQIRPLHQRLIDLANRRDRLERALPTVGHDYPSPADRADRWMTEAQMNALDQDVHAVQERLSALFREEEDFDPEEDEREDDGCEQACESAERAAFERDLRNTIAEAVRDEKIQRLRVAIADPSLPLSLASAMRWLVKRELERGEP